MGDGLSGFNFMSFWAVCIRLGKERMHALIYEILLVLLFLFMLLLDTVRSVLCPSSEVTWTTFVVDHDAHSFIY